MKDFGLMFGLCLISAYFGLFVGSKIIQADEVKLSASNWECAKTEIKGIELECTEYIRIKK